MARTGTGNLLCKRNSKLDSFLKRNTQREVYERIRAYEPCVVISETVNKVFMHVVLSDHCVYLAEYPPRTLKVAVNFSNIRGIELVNDLPDFLSGRDRECSQHIRLIYATERDSGKKDVCGRGRGQRVAHLTPSPSTGSHRNSLAVFSFSEETEGWRTSAVPQRSGEEEEENDEDVLLLKTRRSASCPDNLALRLGLPPPHPLSPSLPLSSPSSPISPVPPSLAFSLSPPSSPHPTSSASSLSSPSSPLSPLPPSMAPRRRSSALASLMRRRGRAGEEGEEGEEREAELHLYAVSPTSRIYLHLQSSWNSYIIRSTLLQDPLYRRKCNYSLQKQPSISWERTAQLFRQLSAEMLQEDLALESLYMLLQELHLAAQRNSTLRKLFWTSGDLCLFLVRRLEESLHNSWRPEVNPTADELLLCSLSAQTLALMFRETELEPARLRILTAEQGALPARLLLALVCDPQLQSQGSEFSTTGQRQAPPPHTELQGLLAEYLDAACSLLFELVVLCQEASRARSLDVLNVGWILKVLQPHPSLRSFVGYQAQQVVDVLSGPQAPLSPAQATLLYQRCQVLVACLQHSPALSLHLRSHYREEFRYYVKVSSLEEKLPCVYPISRPTQRLISLLLGLILHTY